MNEWMNVWLNCAPRIQQAGRQQQGSSRTWAVHRARVGIQGSQKFVFLPSLSWTKSTMKWHFRRRATRLLPRTYSPHWHGYCTLGANNSSLPVRTGRRILWFDEPSFPVCSCLLLARPSHYFTLKYLARVPQQNGYWILIFVPPIVQVWPERPKAALRNIVIIMERTCSLVEHNLCSLDCWLTRRKRKNPRGFHHFRLGESVSRRPTRLVPLTIKNSLKEYEPENMENTKEQETKKPENITLFHLVLHEKGEKIPQGSWDSRILRPTRTKNVLKHRN